MRIPPLCPALKCFSVALIFQLNVTIHETEFGHCPFLEPEWVHCCGTRPTAAYEMCAAPGC
eukprot:3878654-Amphidinium_carterae.1